MTEKEWFATACADAQVLYRGYPGKPSERKLRLFGCACLRHIDLLFRYPDGAKCIEACERYADGEIKGETLMRWGRRAAALRYTGQTPGETDMAQWHAATYLMEACGPGPRYNGWVFTTEKILRSEEPFGPEFIAAAKKRFTLFLRDVFGNPFRPVPFGPSWRSDTVVSLATRMYESRDFGAMPILADALDDAGCDSDAILNHCRADAPHVLGCWVVDLILGRE
jgi:hypothetical protein